MAEGRKGGWTGWIVGILLVNGVVKLATTWSAAPSGGTGAAAVPTATSGKPTAVEALLELPYKIHFQLSLIRWSDFVSKDWAPLVLVLIGTTAIGAGAWWLRRGRRS